MCTKQLVAHNGALQSCVAPPTKERANHGVMPAPHRTPSSRHRLEDHRLEVLFKKTM
jgi:hypothetical protein